MMWRWNGCILDAMAMVRGGPALALRSAETVVPAIDHESRVGR